MSFISTETFNLVKVQPFHGLNKKKTPDLCSIFLLIHHHEEEIWAQQCHKSITTLDGANLSWKAQWAFKAQFLASDRVMANYTLSLSFFLSLSLSLRRYHTHTHITHHTQHTKLPAFEFVNSTQCRLARSSLTASNFNFKILSVHCGTVCHALCYVCTVPGTKWKIGIRTQSNDIRWHHGQFHQTSKWANDLNKNKIYLHNVEIDGAHQLGCRQVRQLLQAIVQHIVTHAMRPDRITNHNNERVKSKEMEKLWAKFITSSRSNQYIFLWMS